MTLVNRVSAFFLAALAIALIGYSAIIYYVISNYLYRQFDGDLHSALDLLAASVEVEPDDAKWHPAEHGIDLTQSIFDEVSWVVCNEDGQVVDRSARVDRKDPNYQPILAYATKQHPDNAQAVERGDWRLLHRELSAPNPKPITLREPHEYTSVRITVGRSVAELKPSLNLLAWLVCALPAVVWLIAAGVGRWFVVKALLPVRAMADRARSMTQADFGLRLPVDAHGDQLSELGAAFNHLLDQLQAAFKRQQRFSGDAAHQLRTPLTVLQGQIDVARRKPRTTEEYQKTLDLLADQTTELGQIVESLLFLARSEEGAAPPNIERVQLGEWLPNYAQRWKTHPRKSDFSLHISTDAAVLVATPLLSQLLDNLINNAFKYSQSGGTVTLFASHDGDKAVLTIKDAGIGIATADQAAIFDPFFRSSEARQAGIAGTGLGLAIVARIAHALGGEISCQSTQGQGSEFSLLLPIETALSADADSAHDAHSRT